IWPSRTTPPLKRGARARGTTARCSSFPAPGAATAPAHLPRSNRSIWVPVPGAGLRLVGGRVLGWWSRVHNRARHDARRQRRRASFLREAIRQARLPCARVVEARAEDAMADVEIAGRARVVVGRAIRLERFLALAAPFVEPNGVAIAMQTPHSVAGRTAGTPALLPAGQREYRLLEGECRTLLFFSPRRSVP